MRTACPSHYLDESSLTDPPPEIISDNDDDEYITWSEIDNATRAPHLTNSLGYSYTACKDRSNSDWVCVVGNKTEEGDAVPVLKNKMACTYYRVSTNIVMRRSLVQPLLPK